MSEWILFQSLMVAESRESFKYWKCLAQIPSDILSLSLAHYSFQSNTLALVNKGQPLGP